MKWSEFWAIQIVIRNHQLWSFHGHQILAIWLGISSCSTKRVMLTTVQNSFCLSFAFVFTWDQFCPLGIVLGGDQSQNYCVGGGGGGVGVGRGWVVGMVTHLKYDGDDSLQLLQRRVCLVHQSLITHLKGRALKGSGGGWGWGYSLPFVWRLGGGGGGGTHFHLCGDWGHSPPRNIVHTVFLICRRGPAPLTWSCSRCISKKMNSPQPVLDPLGRSVVFKYRTTPPWERPQPRLEEMTLTSIPLWPLSTEVIGRNGH